MAPTYYTEITIDATKVDETIPVIPVFLSPGDTTFWTEVQNQNDLNQNRNIVIRQNPGAFDPDRTSVTPND